MEKQWKQWQTLFSWAPKSPQVVTQPRGACSWKKSYDQPIQHTKNQRHYFANKGPSSQSYGFSSSHVWMWELDYKESWAPKNWSFWTVVLEKTPESPLDCKELKAVNPKGNQSWIFTGKTDAEVEAPIIWPPGANSRLTGKDTDASKDLRHEEKWTTKDKRVEWHHQLPEFSQTLVHWFSDAIQPSHPPSSPSPPAPNPSQHQSLFQWVSSSHEVAKVLEFQL